MSQYKAEQQDLQTKIGEIDRQLPQLQIAQIGVEAKAGPILYISKAFSVSIEAAVKYVILLIIVVFDPLAVFLIVAGNFLWDQQKRDRRTEVLDAELTRLNAQKLTEPTWHDNGLTPHSIEEPPAQMYSNGAWRIGELNSFKNPEFADTLELEERDDVPEIPERRVAVLEPESADRVPDSVGTASDASEPRGESAEVIAETFGPREQITLSTLGLVRPDRSTIVNEPPRTEVGSGTGAFTT